MPVPQNYSFIRYLSAKKTVDDRALNQHVWQTLARNLPPSSRSVPLRVLEIGAGIGTMVERVLERELLADADYLALDAQPENIAYARERLPRWASERDYRVEECPQDRWIFSRQGQRLTIGFETGDLFDFAVRQTGRRKWDLLVAHAFLDLMDIPFTLPVLLNLLEENGLFYFTINFDGATLLEPEVDPDLDEHVQSLYHISMNQRITSGRRSGDSRAGRHLFAHLQNAGGRILDAGASDWVVFAGPQGYPDDEAYFIHFIIHTIHQALQGHPELEQAYFQAWIAERHNQVERGELVYIAHQLDFVGRRGR